MIWRGIIIYGIFLASSISVSTGEEALFDRNLIFDCGNEKVVPIIYKCDGDDDCGNGADEQDCSTETIINRRLQNLQLFFRLLSFDCGNGERVPQPVVCNGVNDCGNDADEKDCENNGFDCGNGKRVPNRYLCDNDDDCGNGADEKNCTQSPRRISSPCPFSSMFNFNCGNGKTVSRTALCDGDDDCGNGADEKNCTDGPRRISPMLHIMLDGFDCGNGRTVPNRYLCDGDDDCQNGADERNCTISARMTHRFDCGNGRTVPARWQCDGDNDCRNGQDERNCSHVRFDCGNGRTVLNRYLCDGDNNCLNGADERNCTNSPTTIRFPFASSTENHVIFDCGNGRIVPTRFVCDGDNDCLNGADERNCTNSPTTTGSPLIPMSWRLSGEIFDCGNGNRIPKEWVCDRADDCLNSADERNCSNECGGHLIVSPVLKRVFSYTKSGQEDLENHQSCDWIIRTMPGRIVEVEFLEFQVGNNPTEDNSVVEVILGTQDCKDKFTGDCVQYNSRRAGCPDDFVEVFDGSYDSSLKLGRFCGNSIPPIVKSSNDMLLFRFNPGKTGHPAHFRARYSSSAPIPSNLY